MLDSDILKNKLPSLEGKDYGGYQSLKGEYDFSDYKLLIRQIPKDPYAPPHTGIYCIQVDRKDERVIDFNLESKIHEVAFRDFLTRRFHHSSAEISKTGRGTGFSGIITINQPSQLILDRNCIIMNEEYIEVRCFLGLPAKGRRINSGIAEKMIFEELPRIVEESLFKKNFDSEKLKAHIEIAEDSEFLRNELNKLGLVSFIADGSILPRKSGISDLPLEKDSAVAFISPDSMRKEIHLPNAGKITGMGIPKGVTLIVGGGYHGKSTLLNTLERGCYNHIPEDGRGLCVSLKPSVKIRAYSGRHIAKTDISPFIRNLPFHKDTTAFATENSSGSTSQAASIIEAVEIGAKVLLMDEDTCATNFMIRDEKMQRLVHKDDEPITTYIDSVRQLYSEQQISTILVLGGVGDYFDVSDHVIQMIKYQPLDVTRRAHEISKESTSQRDSELGSHGYRVTQRIPLPESISPFNRYRKKGIYAREVNRLNFGQYEIDLNDLEQLIELSQTKAIGYALDYAKKYMDQNLTLKEVVDRVVMDIETKGLDVLSAHISGHFAEFRAFELAFTMNRLRSFDVTQKE